jgi:hypothetical protein
MWVRGNNAVYIKRSSHKERKCLKLVLNEKSSLKKNLCVSAGPKLNYVTCFFILFYWAEKRLGLRVTVMCRTFSVLVYRALNRGISHAKFTFLRGLALLTTRCEEIKVSADELKLVLCLTLLQATSSRR